MINDYSPLTSNSPTPILEQTWVSKTEVPSKDYTIGPAGEGGLVPVCGAVHPMPPARNRDYTALTISHSAPASKQTSFERGESVERVRPTLAVQALHANAGGEYYYKYRNNNIYIFYLIIIIVGPVAKAISRATDGTGVAGAAGPHVTHATSLDAIARRQHFRTGGAAPARCATISVCKYFALALHMHIKQTFYLFYLFSFPTFFYFYFLLF